jgi:hypothetical protein
MAAKRKAHQISYVPSTVGRGRSGRPIQIRTDGFANDVAYLTRLRTALMMDGKLPRDEKTQTLLQLDSLVESLIRLSHERAEEKQKTA